MNYLPIRGQYWQHRNGIRYVVLYITNTTNENPAHPPDVVYATAKEAGEYGATAFGSDTPAYNPEKIWSRPLSDWHRSFTRMD